MSPCACQPIPHTSGYCRFHAWPPCFRFCQDVLYPSEDVEEQLSILSVYPNLESLTEIGGVEYEEREVESETYSALSVVEGNGAAGTTAGGGPHGELSLQDSLQEKTDEVLKSITSSFAAVTDMFGPKDGHAPLSLSPSKRAVRSDSRTRSDAAGGGAGDVRDNTPGVSTGWDMFKPLSMAEMKRRLDGGGRSMSPARIHNNGVNAGGPGRSSATTTPTGGFGMFGDSLRDFRRRGQEAVDEAVTKLKSALDGSDDDEPNGRKSGASTAESKSSAIRAAARSGRAYEAEDNSFWRPFGDAGPGTSEEPVPLPPMPPGQEIDTTSLSVRKPKSQSKSPARSSAKERLDAYYGGGVGSAGR